MLPCRGIVGVESDRPSQVLHCVLRLAQLEILTAEAEAQQGAIFACQQQSLEIFRQCAHGLKARCESPAPPRDWWVFKRIPSPSPHCATPRQTVFPATRPCPAIG